MSWRRSGPNLPRLVVAAAILVLMGSCSGPDPGVSAGPDEGAPGPASTAGSSALTFPRVVHRASALQDGRVLITGGCTLVGCEGFDQGQHSDLFDPVTGLFTAGPSMSSPRAGHTATVLGDGRVLLVGGYPGEGRPALATAEVFDPATEQFQAVGSLSVGRADHTASLMPSGHVLISGGTTGTGEVLATTEIFDPRTNGFEPGQALSGPRSGQVAVFVDRRLVLIGGTADAASAVDTTDVLYQGAWSPGPRLGVARVKHAAMALPDGSALVIGGATSTEGRELLSSTEVLTLDPARSRPGPALSEGQYKLDGLVSSLPDGRVVIAGGHHVDVYDPATAKVSVVGGVPVPRRSFASASTAGASTVLIAGGYDSAIVPTADARLVHIPRTL